MSITAMAWALKLAVGSPTLKLVLLSIANYADEDGRCWPSQERLCRDTELSERSVRDALKRLEDTGIISRTVRHINGNKRQTDIIQLVASHRQDVPVAPPANSSKSHRQMAPKPPAGAAGKPSIVEPLEEEPLSGEPDLPPKSAKILSRPEYPGDYEMLWAEFPKNPNASKLEGYRAWCRLSPEDRESCFDGAMSYASWLLKQARPPTTIHLVNFIQQRRFDGFADQAAAQ